ncbi:MAG: hypothetical protein ACREYE_18050 [Gammaproteobacteria bacterium]
MSTKKPLARPTVKSIASYVRKNAIKVKEAQHQHDEVNEIIRKASYKGHRIVVRTSYQIQVDDMPITGHIGVTDDGHVHYHPVPNVSFASAVDLVKQLIDVFPDDFTSAHDTAPQRGPRHPAKSPHQAKKTKGHK